MLQPVGKLVEAPRIVDCAQPVVLVEIRAVGNFRTQPTPGCATGAARRLDLTELAGKSQLTLIVEILAAQNQHRMAIYGSPDLARRFPGQSAHSRRR